MTVYGGRVKGDGVHLDADGFFVVCCKCGWHSEVEMRVGIPYGPAPDYYVWIKCKKCGNEYEEWKDWKSNETKDKEEKKDNTLEGGSQG